MRKRLFTLSIAINLISFSLLAKDELKKDTLYTELKNDVVILSNIKETNSLRSLPAAVSVFSNKNLNDLQVSSLKDLNAIIPNYSMADYGSKMTAPIYIRGIGARSGDQTVSMYVDNIPYFNTTAFDVELFDVQRIEVLRGTQGTLYGRNAMGGIINVYTYSPLNYEGTTIKVGGGSYGLINANASTYRRLNSKMGISIGGYYKKNDGYFINKFTDKKADNLKNIGGRAKFAWDIKPNLNAEYSFNFDYVDQGAFPYASSKTGEIDYNSEGYYKRKLITNGLSLKYTGVGYELNSITGYQYLNDEMNMDQDNTRLSIFQINQSQRQNSLSEEITIKSTTNANYQWSFGTYGFYDYLHTTPPVYMMKDGIYQLMQKPLDDAHATNPNIPMPTIKYTDDQIAFNGNYKRPTYGAAVFHQSTFNNILQTQGLSLTLGLRLDYEKTKLDYNSDTHTSFDYKEPHTPPAVPFERKLADTTMIGTSTSDFLELLPKAVLKYQAAPNSFVYFSASRGYKSGGHNIQVFADLLEEALNAKVNQLGGRPSTPPKESINDRITYKPEYSWNYEIGGQIGMLDNTLSTNFTFYYMDVRDVQITQFVSSGRGRMVSNAGKAVSKGFELGLKVRPCKGFYLYGNYGFADARFKEYKVTQTDRRGNKTEIDYMNKHIPFAPTSTYTVGGNISYDFKSKSVFDRITFDVNYSGVGRIYWQEDNNLYQTSYGTLNGSFMLDKNKFSLEFWMKNILDESYDAFFFTSMNQSFYQKGKPMRWGAALKIKL